MSCFSSINTPPTTIGTPAASVFTPVCGGGVTSETYLSLSEVRKCMQSKTLSLTEAGQDRMDKGMPLRKMDFQAAGKKKSGVVAALSRQFDGENKDPNANLGRAKPKSETPKKSELFTDDYWGVPKKAERTAQSPARAVSPERPVVRAPLAPKMKSPAKLKSPGRRTNKKTKSVRKRMLKRAMLEMGGAEVRKEEDVGVGVGEVREERAAGGLDGLRKRIEGEIAGVREWAEPAAAKLKAEVEMKVAKGRVEVGEMVGRAEVEGRKMAKVARSKVEGMSVAERGVYALFIVALLFSVLTAGGSGKVVVVEEPVSFAAIQEPSREPVAVAVQEPAAVVVEEPVVSTEVAGAEESALPEMQFDVTSAEESALPAMQFDITSATISADSLLSWTVAGPSVTGKSKVDVVVLVDDKVHYKSPHGVPLFPDAGGDSIEMTVDLLPLTNGLHKFQVVVAAADGDFYREASGNFVHEPPLLAAVGITWPIHGEFVDSRGVSVKFGTANMEHMAGGGEGLQVALSVDGERFELNFFEGEISLDGLVAGPHEVAMVVVDGEGQPVGDGDRVAFIVV
ncbi:hypothetical protein TeGR_g11466 [Tetraparma gracilis]|uniref:Uncharacterized protein n=1 Tax=Tetraparma gracilis TaxID=2962635 RepID=A0ABQ6MA53_9STRA|nr:hypothetical protein TeGR_g11466 [Tetraparma gracilis]